MKKLMLTTAIASVLTTAAIAQTSITGELRVSYKDVTMDKGRTGSTTKDTDYGFGSEQQINVQTKGKLNVGGLDYAAGFSIENDGEQTGTLFNENVYMDFTNASSGTTISFGRDHIQRSDSDFSATNLVGFNNNELSQIDNGTNKGTFFVSSIGAAPGQNFGAAILQKTPVGTFSYNWVPNNASPTLNGGTATAINVGLSGSEQANANSTSAYEAGFVGDLTVKGLTVHYFQNKNSDYALSASTVKAEGKNYGAKYNMGQITLAANKKEHTPEIANNSVAPAITKEVTEKSYSIAYAINKDLSVSALYAKADQATVVPTHELKAINIGYALGPVNLSVGYAKNTDAGGVAGADHDVVMARLIGAF
jgi:hypothetical protein